MSKAGRLILLFLAVAAVAPHPAAGENYSHTLSSGWNLFSLPLTPADSNPITGLGLTNQEIFGYGANSFLAPSGGLTLGVANGYWLKTSGPLTLSVQGTPVSTQSSYRIWLQAGWNLIGNPFNESIPVSSLSLNGGSFASSTIIQGVLFGYDLPAKQYQEASLLEPWKAYWVWGSGNCSVAPNNPCIECGCNLDIHLAPVPAQPTVTGGYYTMLEISWQASPSPDVAGYNVKINGSKVNDEVITGTTFSIGGLPAGGTYNVQVQAVMAFGGESALSNAAIAATLAVSGDSGVVSGRIIMPESGGASRILSRAAFAVPEGYIPATGTAVILKNTSYQTVTDNGGWFELAGVPPATYELDASKDNGTPGNPDDDFAAVVNNVQTTAGQVKYLGDITAAKVAPAVPTMTGTETHVHSAVDCGATHGDSYTCVYSTTATPRTTFTWTPGTIPDISGIWNITYTTVSCQGTQIGYKFEGFMGFFQDGGSFTWNLWNYGNRLESTTGTVNAQGMISYSGQDVISLDPCPPQVDSITGTARVLP